MGISKNPLCLIIGLLAGLLHVESKNFLALMTPMVFCFGFPIFIVSGRWMGIRCGKYPYLLTVSAGIILKLLVVSTDSLILSKKTYAEIFSGMDMGNKLRRFSDIFFSLSFGCIFRKETSFIGVLKLFTKATQTGK
jgi:hypothetical protein